MKAIDRGDVMALDRNNSKLNVTVKGYLVQKPSSLTSFRFKKNQNEDNERRQMFEREFTTPLKNAVPSNELDLGALNISSLKEKLA